MKIKTIVLPVLLAVMTVAPMATLAYSNDLNTIYLLQAQVASLQQVVATLLAVQPANPGNKLDEPPGQAKKITPTPTSIPTPVSTFAQPAQPTSTPTQATPEAQEVRKAMIEQIEQVQTKLQAAQNSLTTMQNTIQAQESVSGVELKLTRTLQRGSSGDDVKQLQGYLKNFPNIYPEGLITGNFGPLTEKAVARFQEKNGLEAVGFVGPRTRAELNKQAVVSDCSQTLERPCYDKIFGGATSKLEKTNGENSFSACINNSSNSSRAEGQMQTSFCSLETMSYCYEGQSGNQIRKFVGTCAVTPTPTPTPTPTASVTPTPTPTPTLIQATATIPDVVTVFGRWFNHFTKNPIVNAVIMTWDGSVSRSVTTNSNGEFSISASTSPITVTAPKGFVSWSACYAPQGFFLFRKADGSMTANIQVHPLTGAPQQTIPITSPEIHFADIPFWPAVDIQINSDIIFKFGIWTSPGSGVGTGGFKNINSLTNSFMLEADPYATLTDQAGNIFVSPTHRVPLSYGCKPQILSYYGGVFKWEEYPLDFNPIGGNSLTVGATYNRSIGGVSGGIAPYTWSVVTGALPPGITFSPSGVFSGVPTQMGSYTAMLKALDTNGVSNAMMWTLTVR